MDQQTSESMLALYVCITCLSEAVLHNPINKSGTMILPQSSNEAIRRLRANRTSSDPFTMYINTSLLQTVNLWMQEWKVNENLCPRPNLTYETRKLRDNSTSDHGRATM